jgi:hypothetical protein
MMTFPLALDSHILGFTLWEAGHAVSKETSPSS